MGQGIATQVVQVAAYVLNVPMEMIQVETTRRPASRPTPPAPARRRERAYNGEAVKRTCQELRLAADGIRLRDAEGERRRVVRRQQGIDFWNYGSRVGRRGDVINGANQKLIWQYLVRLAYQNRVSLIATFTAPIHGGRGPVPAMTFKPR